MSQKSRKSLSSPWMTCDKCNSIVSHKDTSVHETECPPSKDNWSHNYIHDCILYTTVELYAPKEFPKNITERNSVDMVFMSQSALELCKIAIADRVMLTFNNNIIVKTAFPTTEKSVTSVCMSKDALEINDISGLVKVQRFNDKISFAKEIIIDYVSKKMRPELTSDLEFSIKYLNERKAFVVGNRISIPFYGRQLVFKIMKIIGEKAKKSLDTSTFDLENELQNLSIMEKHMEFFESRCSTKWTLLNDEEKQRSIENSPTVTILDVGGYEELLEKLRRLFNIILGKSKRVLHGFKSVKGILLYGITGVGKTTIARAILSQYDVNIFTAEQSTFIGDSGKKLKELFEKAKQQSPSVIFIDDIDRWCPKKSSTTSENERRECCMENLVEEIVKLQQCDAQVLLLTTCTKLELLDNSLRQAKIMNLQLEIVAPTPGMRCKILKKILSKISNKISDEEFDNIAFITHGFVAADLVNLCNEACLCALTKGYDTVPTDVFVSNADLIEAHTLVSPSAMKEFLIEVPNVKWSDIGGLESLKLKLKQAVEWPLKYSNSFKKLGIKPPTGTLMYGPPGCSKTMVARALATESKLNFISIKGPELFSKWVGESEKAIREIFRKARQVAPTIIFIDEIESLGGGRAMGNGGSTGNNVQERVLTTLLTELAGVTASENVILVGATNRPDKIDPALLRPGRFDRLVYVPLPDAKTREEIFRIKLKKMLINADVDILDLVKRTDGFSGAEIEAICYEAGMAVLEENLIEPTSISRRHFDVILSKSSPRTPPSFLKLYEDYQKNNE